MANYKIIIAGDEQDDVFSTYEDAEQYAQYLVSCYHTGAEELDYPDDPDHDPEYEIIETDESVEKPDEALIFFQKVMNSPGVYDDEGEFVRCPNCGRGLHNYNGVITCPECGAV